MADAAEQLRLYQRGDLVPLNNAEIARRTANAEEMMLTSKAMPEAGFEPAGDLRLMMDGALPIRCPRVAV